MDRNAASSGKVKPTGAADHKELPRDFPTARRHWAHTNMAAKSLPFICLLCILSGTACSAAAAGPGEQQQSFLKVRHFWFFPFLLVSVHASF